MTYGPMAAVREDVNMEGTSIARAIATILQYRTIQSTASLSHFGHNLDSLFHLSQH